ncbi:hypothetical protein GCM10009539_75380 [Cryptosporangium japonicum]|uniref:Uncharacterized protein n=1 Tax=Cryptosporangium japonicum TaxID=80872 RepID=A0ABN0V5K5_9ACTN
MKAAGSNASQAVAGSPPVTSPKSITATNRGDSQVARVEIAVQPDRWPGPGWRRDQVLPAGAQNRGVGKVATAETVDDRGTDLAADSVRG